MKTPFVCYFAAVALAANLHGASYDTTFPIPPFTNPGEVAGKDGWVINDTTPNLSFTVLWNGSNAGALGGLFDVPTVSPVGLTHAYAETLGGTSMSFNFTIVDSTDAFPNRDVFGISLANAGVNLFTVFFTPSLQTLTPSSGPDGQWNLSYVAGAGLPVSLTQGVLEGGTYLFDLELTPSGASTAFDLTVTGSTTENRLGSFAVDPNSNASDFGVNWTPTFGPDVPGNNYFLFDNLAVVVVPESSSAWSLLVLCLAGLGVVSRRQRA